MIRRRASLLLLAPLTAAALAMPPGVPDMPDFDPARARDLPPARGTPPPSPPGGTPAPDGEHFVQLLLRIDPAGDATLLAATEASGTPFVLAPGPSGRLFALRIPGRDPLLGGIAAPPTPYSLDVPHAEPSPAPPVLLVINLPRTTRAQLDVDGIELSLFDLRPGVNPIRLTAADLATLDPALVTETRLRPARPWRAAIRDLITRTDAE